MPTRQGVPARACRGPCASARERL